MFYLQINIFQKEGEISINVINRNDNSARVVDERKRKGKQCTVGLILISCGCILCELAHK